jgi:hypothetical protein
MFDRYNIMSEADLREAMRRQSGPTRLMRTPRFLRAHELLGQQMRMPKCKDRAGHLQAQREEFASSQKVALPLMCASMQTDRDKHVAYSPLKELRFEHVLATNAFLEACDLWGAAVDAERRARSTA